MWEPCIQIPSIWNVIYPDLNMEVFPFKCECKWKWWCPRRSGYSAIWHQKIWICPISDGRRLQLFRPSLCAILVKFHLTPAWGIPNIHWGHEVWLAYLPRPAHTSPAKHELQW